MPCRVRRRLGPAERPGGGDGALPGRGRGPRRGLERGAVELMSGSELYDELDGDLLTLLASTFHVRRRAFRRAVEAAGLGRDLYADFAGDRQRSLMTPQRTPTRPSNEVEIEGVSGPP